MHPRSVLEIPRCWRNRAISRRNASSAIFTLLRGVDVGGPMGAMNFEAAYDDFRTVGGLLFVCKETTLASGTKTGDTIISKVEILKATPEGAFSP